MSLSPGSRLSHYRLAEPIGQGGMGEVWRANDSTLGRDVAIKVLPAVFASDPERVARLEREARLLASLNHPHIASIYGMHQDGDVRFLAMELIQGEDLARRIERGPVPLPEALRIAHQIALALEHAHERGIVHRDLKPANVALTAEGQVKVLDFGLAKALEGEAPDADSPTMVERSPAITGRMTGANVLLGTAAYMAPEQARGRRADRRADIWAFGVVLMEMLTGRRLFEGETISDTLASVLKTEPDWSTLPAETPPRIRRLLRRCLERDPMKRLRDIGEARISLEEAMSGAADESAIAGPAARQGPLRPLAFAGAGLLVGILITAVVMGITRPPAKEPPLRRFRLSLPEGGKGSPSYPRVSPDGTKVAYVYDGRIWLQALDEIDPKTLVTDAGADMPFWSPDGRFVGYMSGTRLMKVPVAGGDPQVICDTRDSFVGGSGASWGADDEIAFSHADSSGLEQVSARGGDPRVLLKPDSTESDFHEPSILPGGRGILFGAHKLATGVDNLNLWANGRRTTILRVPGHWLYDPVYSSTGHILYRRDAPTPGIWALPFSLSRLKPTGEPFLVAEGAQYPSVSDDGTLAYFLGETGKRTQLAWVDRDGKNLGPIGDVKENAGYWPSVSPDGRRVARSEVEAENHDIWIYDTTRGTRSRLTFDPGLEDGAAWSPDGATVAYHAIPKGCSGVDCWRVLTRAANGTGAIDSIGRGIFPAYSPDGRFLTFTQFPENGDRWDLMARDLNGGRAAIDVVQGKPRAMAGAVAPGGAYIAYQASESGKWEVYLARFPSGAGKWQVSASGGQWPHWNAAGNRLYFLQGDDIVEVDVTLGAAPVLGTPHRLFSRPPLGHFNFDLAYGYAMTRDASRFVVLQPEAGAGAASVKGVTVVQSWYREFQKR